MTRIMRVFVLAPDDQPLMPMHPAKARRLLKAGRAEVVRRTPFTIRLLFEPSGRGPWPGQEVEFKTDDGAKAGGVAVIQHRTVKPDAVVFAGEINLSNDTKRKLDQRRNYRRARRYRLGHREERRDNRPRTKCRVCGRNARKGADTCRSHASEPAEVRNFVPWLPPSQKARKDRIVRAAAFFRKITPVTAATVETGSFDTQAMQGIAPGNGPKRGSRNTREALNKIQRGKCQRCGAEGFVAAAHLTPRRERGTDAWVNRALLCPDCLEKARVPMRGAKKLVRTMRYAARLQAGKNYLRLSLERALRVPARLVDGKDTAAVRDAWGLSKTHANDAAACGRDPKDRPPVLYRGTAVRITCRTARTRQAFKAQVLSPKGPFPPWASFNRRVRIGTGVRVRVEANAALGTDGRVYRAGEFAPQNAFRKGDWVAVRVQGAVPEGRVVGVRSRGVLKVALPGRGFAEASPGAVVRRRRERGVNFSTTAVGPAKP